MARKHLGFGHVTLVCLALGLSRYVVSADNEIGEDNIPEEACFLDNNMKKHLICTSDVKSAFGDNFYVDEHSYCSHELEPLCLTCIDGTMEEMPCHDPPKERRKRWWWGRRGRRSGPPPNSAPRITCPNIASSFTAPPGSVSIVVTWGNPSTSDNDGNIRSTSLISGKSSGSSFSEGSHTVSYRVTDSGGLSASCSRTFIVRVIRCPQPIEISQGAVQCQTTVGLVYGTVCTYSCNSGWEISGSATVTCQQNGAFTASPACRRISCGPPPLPPNALSTKCTNGHLFESLCSPVCEQGYVPGRSARLYCPENKKWAPGNWVCQDEVSPVFTDCPTKKINTIDRNYRWSITATDNTGKVTVKQIRGDPPGSVFQYGTHLIKYQATDPSGNRAFCDFVFELKATDCPIPTSDDKDISYTCNGMTATSVCQLSCGTGSRVVGSKYIACVKDKTGNNTSSWEPVEGTSATCYRKKCSPLNTPKNGALICDKQLGGTLCQIQCNEDYDIAYTEERFHTFVCVDNKGTWKPRSTAPDCMELSFPDYYTLPTDFYYFMGDCSDENAVQMIKQQFINNLNSIGVSPCVTTECSVDNVELSCGDTEEIDDFWSRRKRSTSSNKERILHVSLKIRVKNTNGTLSPEAATTLMNSVADKSDEVLSTNMVMRQMLANFLPKPSAPPSENGTQPTAPMPILPSKVKSVFITGNVSMACKAGQIQANISEPSKCVPCSPGSYADQGTCQTCPLNTYQDTPGSTTCHPCPERHTTLSTGAVAREDCQETCGLDMFSPTGRAPCFPCPDEEHQPTIGSTTCVPCPDFHIVGQVSLKCLYRTFKPKNDTTVPDEFRVSSYLLTCDKEICLKF